jgi:multisubunit Na+/H+ antiporter MnhG subunit
MDSSIQAASNVNPVALLFLVATSVVMLRAQRQTAVKALLAIAAFLPLGQQFVLFGLHLYFFRVLILVGFCRLLSRGEARALQFSTMDKLVVAWILVALVCSTLRDPSSFAGASCLGGAFNAFGAYFLFRALINDPDELVGHLSFLALVAGCIALAMLYEEKTHKNWFAVLGGVPEATAEREGRLRCQGPFRHPILAGTFAATLFPLMIGLWLQAGRKKWLAVPGILGCVFCTVAASSSGALLTCLTALIGFALWPMRWRMQLIRRGLVVLILALAVVMKAPVWYLIAKASELMGGTGWHRSYLIDQAVNHFGEWWLIGSSYTAHWAPSGQVLPADPNNMDITNHYIAQGLHGGCLGLGLFIAVIVSGFKVIGRALRTNPCWSVSPGLWWAFGVCLACHCTAFVSISYFDQIEMFWFWLLAALAAAAAWQKQVAVAADLAPSVADLAEANAAGVAKQAVHTGAANANHLSSAAILRSSL